MLRVVLIALAVTALGGLGRGSLICAHCVLLSQALKKFSLTRKLSAPT